MKPPAKKVLSLSRARKQRQRAAKRAEGDANSARFGQPAAERRRLKDEAEKAARDLDGHRRE